jgi:hypothetical protein
MVESSIDNIPLGMHCCQCMGELEMRCDPTIGVKGLSPWLET